MEGGKCHPDQIQGSLDCTEPSEKTLRLWANTGEPQTTKPPIFASARRKGAAVQSAIAGFKTVQWLISLNQLDEENLGRSTAIFHKKFSLWALLAKKSSCVEEPLALGGPSVRGINKGGSTSGD
jgi:hypothetical protein